MEGYIGRDVTGAFGSKKEATWNKNVMIVWARSETQPDSRTYDNVMGEGAPRGEASLGR